MITMQELIIAMPLAMMLLALLVHTLVSSSRRTAQLTAQAQMQETATFILQRIENELATTPAAGVGILHPESPSDPTAISLNRLATVDASGLRTYEDGLVLYVFDPTRKTLVMREFDDAPAGLEMSPIEGFRPGCGDLKRLATQTSPSSRLLASGVAEFKVTSDAPTGHVGSPLTLRLVLERNAIPGQKEVETMERTFTLRN
ncbi:MAG: hypothetical protein FJX76_05485 [Armatimonadetes bacterium]|nr:hypothetical protein [Armatimonadota bacterium]